MILWYIFFCLISQHFIPELRSVVQSENMNSHQWEAHLFFMMSIQPENQKTWKPVSKLCSILLFYMGNFHPPITRKKSWLLPHLDRADYKVHSSTRDVLWDQIFYDLCGKCEIPLTRSPIRWQCAGEMGHLTSITCHGRLWQRHPLGHSPF